MGDLYQLGNFDLLSCGNKLLTCGNDLLTWGNELLTHGHDFSHGEYDIKMSRKQFYVPNWAPYKMEWAGRKLF